MSHPVRGLTHAEAMAYVGVKRRTFDEVWRRADPEATQLPWIHSGREPVQP